MREGRAGAKECGQCLRSCKSYQLTEVEVQIAYLSLNLVSFPYSPNNDIKNSNDIVSKMDFPLLNINKGGKKNLLLTLLMATLPTVVVDHLVPVPVCQEKSLICDIFIYSFA